MPFMVTIQPWVIYFHVLFDFEKKIKIYPPIQLPKKQFFSFLFRKKCSQAGFKPGTLTSNPERKHALDRSAMAPFIIFFVVMVGCCLGCSESSRLYLKDSPFLQVQAGLTLLPL